MKNSKGITLIALIITIIVMLILVGVTINVAINGGIFEKAKEAAQKTERQIIYDEIVASMVLTDGGMIDPDRTQVAAIETLNSEGKTAIDLLEHEDAEEEEEEPEEPVDGQIKAIIVNEKYAFIITCARIIDITDAIEDENFTLALKWADVGITNLVPNVEYKAETDSLIRTFYEDDSGISMGGEVNGEDWDVLDNGTLFYSFLDNKLVPNENVLLNGNETLYFYGDRIVVHNNVKEQEVILYINQE